VVEALQLIVAEVSQWFDQIRSTATREVATTSDLAAMLNPMWLSLIWMKLARLRECRLPNGTDR
jgi:hypothetical protein